MASRIAAFKDLSADDLRSKEKELDDQLFRLRIQKSMGQLEAPLKVRTVRRDLARVKTLRLFLLSGRLSTMATWSPALAPCSS
jgi:large subunit ribosomal protein L29